MDSDSLLWTAKDDVDRLLFIYSERNADNEEVLNFWKDKIRLYCLSNNSLSCKRDEVIESFTKYDIVPSSFGNSIELLVEKGDDVSTKDKLVYQQQQDLTQYIVSSTFSFLSPKKSPNQRYVSVLLLKELHAHIQRYVNSIDEKACVFLVNTKQQHDNKFSFHSFLKAAGEYSPSKSKTLYASFFDALKAEDVKIVLDYLLLHGKAVLSSDGAVVKILREGLAGSSTSPSSILSLLGTTSCAPPIKESEIARLQLSVAIRQIEVRVGDLEKKAMDQKMKALKNKKSGNTGLALMHLNLKRNTEKARDTMLKSLLSLTETADKIEECDMNVVITNAYVLATNGLRSTREESGITPESVEDAMDQFEQEMEEMNDISSAMCESRGKISQEEEAELGAELDLMMQGLSLSSPLPGNAAEENEAPIAPTTGMTTSVGDAPFSTATASVTMPVSYLGRTDERIERGSKENSAGIQTQMMAKTTNKAAAETTEARHLVGILPLPCPTVKAPVRPSLSPTRTRKPTAAQGVSPRRKGASPIPFR